MEKIKHTIVISGLTSLIVSIFLFCITSFSSAATFCVGTSAELQTALTVAGANSQNDLIQVQQDTYIGNFVYASTESNSLTVEGGYAAGCASRVVAATNTVLDAGGSDFVFRFGPPGPPSSSTANGDFVIDGLTFQNGNVTGTQGGGLAIRTDGNTLISNSIIANNQVTSSAGGGLFIYGQGNITLNNNIISDNIALNGSNAGISISPCKILNVTNSTISNNFATYNTGGLFVADAMEIYLDNNIIFANVGEDDAGGIRIRRANKATLTRNSITDNSTNQQGGGVHLWGLQEAILDSNIIRNNSSLHGGGVWIANTVIATLMNNIILNNTADLFGAGVYLYWGDTPNYNFSVINNTISQNSTNGKGGGIYVELFYATNTASIYNNIIMDNIGNIGADLYIENDPDGDNSPNGIVNLENNDFNQILGFFIQPTPFTIPSSNLYNVDPKFDIDGYHLTDISPCIDAGMDAGVYDDIDGDFRPQGAGYDIGADEYVISDSDGDGIPDDEDSCPNSDMSETVTIDDCDSGVQNVLLEDGCTISDLISQCYEDAENHGEFVSSVSHMTNNLKKNGIISGKEKGKIQKCTTNADNP